MFLLKGSYENGFCGIRKMFIDNPQKLCDVFPEGREKKAML